MKNQIVLVRHGESVWNKENLFTGWTDVDLSEKGIAEARAAGRLLRDLNLKFDLAYTSVLKRAIKTLSIILEETDQLWIPEVKAWQLNERHYGALQGLNKQQTVEEYGEDQVFVWRRSFDTPPTALKKSDPRHPRHDQRYKNLKTSEVPATEALSDCMKRVVPYFKKVIMPQMKAKKRLIIVAHGNSLRALIKHLEGIPNDEISSLNIPTGIPMVYEFDHLFKPKKRYYLGDQEAANEAAKAVANQTAKKS